MLKKFNTLFSFVHSVVKSLHVGNESHDVPQAQSGLHARISGQLKACSAAALLAVGGLADADAAVVHWQNANLVIPNNIDGLYINVETRATGSAGSIVAGWDINPYSATSLTWFNATGTGMMRFPGVTTGSAGSLALGTSVGSAGSFGSGAVTVGSAAGNWSLNASNYFGFRFVAADGGTKYGWGRFVIGASISGADRMIAELAYEDSGQPILVGNGATIACTAPSLSGLVTDAGCSGATNGGVDLTATGGSPTPLSYLWSNGATTEDLLNVGPGSYTVTVRAGTCSTSSNFTVGIAAQVPQPTIACYETATYNNNTCQWDVTGSQPAQPTGLASWQTANFNPTTCQWDVIGTPPVGGTVVYANSASSPMRNAVVVLKQRISPSPSTDYYRITPITYAPESFSGSFGPIGDDVVSGAVPIGFDFNFFGNVYSNLYISTNGFLTFNPGSSSGCCSGQNIPNANSPNNLIALAWTDLVANAGGDITYTTLGVAPNRRFVVNYSVVFYDDNSVPVQVQAVLFEGTNEIEIHTTTVTGGITTTTQGIENANGTIAFSVTGRNASQWSGSNDAFRFTPEGSTEVARDTTDATGAYLMPSIAAGNYDVEVTPNTPWGGVNATDAVLTLNHFSNRVLLSGIRLTAADVNGSASVNSTDALNTLNRFTGALQTFSAGNYTASTSSYTSSGTGSGTLNVSMLCYGDVNASYQPNGGFVRTRWNDLSTQGVALITSGSYEVPLFVSRGVQPAGVSLELELPEGLRVLGVRASEALSASQVVYHQVGTRVRMAWLDESGAELKAGEALCYVQVEGSTEGVWRSSTEVELANVLGEVQSGVALRMPKLSSSLGAMEASVYPNPGRGLRTLALELSEGMGVGVRVTDALGRTVYTHTAGTLAPGTHRMELNMEGWPAGSYQVQVLGATAEGKTHQRSITVLQTR